MHRGTRTLRLLRPGARQGGAGQGAAGQAAVRHRAGRRYRRQRAAGRRLGRARAHAGGAGAGREVGHQGTAQRFEGVRDPVHRLCHAGAVSHRDPSGHRAHRDQDGVLRHGAHHLHGPEDAPQGPAAHQGRPLHRPLGGATRWWWTGGAQALHHPQQRPRPQRQDARARALQDIGRRQDAARHRRVRRSRDDPEPRRSLHRLDEETGATSCTRTTATPASRKTTRSENAGRCRPGGAAGHVRFPESCRRAAGGLPAVRGTDGGRRDPHRRAASR